jgi:membrane-bound serine protease (ClpP class)
MGPGCKCVLIAPVLTALLGLSPLAGAAADIPPPRTEKSAGWVIRLTLPIDSTAFSRVTRFVDGALERARSQKVRPILVFQFDVPKGQEKSAAATPLGAAKDLADLISSDKLNQAVTVAYVPQSLPGHAVLVALACQQIIMGKDATLGPACTDQKDITPSDRGIYADVANQRRTLPKALALGLLDPQLEIFSVKTESGTRYVTTEDLEELKKNRTVQAPEVIKHAGEPWQLDAGRLSLLGFVHLADNRLKLAQALDLPPNSLVDDPSLTGQWQAIRVDLKVPIRSGEAGKIQKLIEDHVRQGANFVCLWINCPGGDPAESANLANFLASLPADKVRTVAYIPSKALAQAAVVAEACDQVVMRPDALLGGWGDKEMSPREIDDFTEVIRRSIAPQKGRYWSLTAALIDPRLTVYECIRKDGQKEYLSDEELQQPENAGRWTRGNPITLGNAPLQVKGSQATNLGLAYRTVGDYGQFCREYGLEKEPEPVEPGWANVLIDALGSTGVAVLLLIIGLAGLYIEMHSPGMFIGAFVALVCFSLFFWSCFLGKTAGWLEVILFLGGVTCLLLEIFVIPGFGIFGLGGGAMILVSLILASQTFVIPHNSYQLEQLQHSLLTVAGAMGGLLVGIFFLRKWLPRATFLGRLVLEPPDEVEREDIGRRELLVDRQELVGQRGVTATPLYPAGKVRLGDALIDVVADGEMIERGKTVEVVEVRGNRVLVREV